MKRSALLVPLAAIGLVLGACSPSASPGQPAPATQQQSVRSAAVKVPTDMVGKTVGTAKHRLAELGFTNVVVTGNDVSNADTVAAVPQAGETAARNATIVVVGQESGRGTAAKRTPPTAGSQCRPGDEKRYRVCAEHKAIVGGQVEFNNCIKSGGKWDIPTQSCVREDG